MSSSDDVLGGRFAVYDESCTSCPGVPQMSNRRNQTLNSLPIADHIPSAARAVEWLEDRYLLAKPVNAAPTRQPQSSARISRWTAGDRSFALSREESKS